MKCLICLHVLLGGVAALVHRLDCRDHLCDLLRLCAAGRKGGNLYFKDLAELIQIGEGLVT